MTTNDAGTLVSVNVGLPRDVAWRGRTVHTGVWKRPVDGPRVVRRLNIDGDGQGDLAGHGGEQRAVLVYQLDSYRHWSRELGREDLSAGHFGENFTIDGLADDRVRIGDRYRIGTALFEVSQPRVTCYRVGLRLDEPRIPALLVSHRRPGFYLRVIVEGEVSAGDRIELVAAGPEGMTVAEVDALLYLPGHPRDSLTAAAAIPALSAGWRASFEAMLRSDINPAEGNAGLGLPAPPPAWPGFRSLRVTDVVPESGTVTSFHLADPSGASLPHALPGQFVVVRLPGSGGRPLLRNYSLSGPATADSYRISVHREAGGVGSRYLHKAVHRGGVLDVAAPRGTFTLQPSATSASPVLLISAGVGATPVLAMLHSLAATGSQRDIWWLHTVRDGSRLAFGGEVDALLAQLPHARRHLRYTSPQPGDIGYDGTGRLSVDSLAALELPSDADAYLCGPTGFISDVTAALLHLGLSPAQVHNELFGSAPPVTPGIDAAPTVRPHTPPGDPGGGPSVAYARSGLTVGWDPAYASLLELAEACDVPVRWSCRTGVCQTCRTSLLSGSVEYSPEPVEHPADGEVLICCARPTRDLAIDL